MTMEGVKETTGTVMDMEMFISVMLLLLPQVNLNGISVVWLRLVTVAWRVYVFINLDLCIVTDCQLSCTVLLI